jgi:hypothetical protein
MTITGNRISRIVTLFVALVFFDLGCTTFGTVDGKRFISSNRPQQVWIWKADSSVMLVRGPHFLGGDTLVGMVEGDYKEIPFDQVTQVKASRSAPMKTTALVVGGAGAIVITTVLIKKSNNSGELNCLTDAPCFCDESCKNP